MRCKSAAANLANFAGCKNIAEEIATMAPAGSRARDVFVLRILGDEVSLRKIGDKYLISKERVRQLECLLLCAAIGVLYGANGPRWIRTAYDLANRMGEAFTMDGWYELLVEQGLLGEFPHTAADLRRLTVFERLLSFTDRICSEKLFDVERCPISTKLVAALEEASASRHLNALALRKAAGIIVGIARRGVREFGFIQRTRLVAQTGYDPHLVDRILFLSGYVFLDADHATHPRSAMSSHSVLGNALRKWLPLNIGEIEIDTLYSLLFSLYEEAHQEPLSTGLFFLILRACGFSVDAERKVTLPSAFLEPGNPYNKAEVAFMAALEEAGPILSSSELILYFLAHGLSASSVPELLLKHYAPLPERVVWSEAVPAERASRLNCFKLRGSRTDAEDDLAAVLRNEETWSSSVINRRSDGLITYNFKVTTFMTLTGIVKAESPSDLLGVWQILPAGTEEIVLGRSFIRLPVPVIRHLTVSPGGDVRVVLSPGSRSASIQPGEVG